MKIVIVTRNATVIDTINDFDEYDLDQPSAQADLMEDLKDAQKRGREMEEVGN